MTKAEVVLWSRLKGRQLLGLKFRRQHSIGPFILDFYCPELKLAIEVDGASHFLGDSPVYDAERQSYIENFGIRFLRFTNLDVLENIEGVLVSIMETVCRIKNTPFARGT